MVVIMKREFTPEQLEAAVHTMEEGGVKVMVSKGAETTILGAEGNAEHIDQEKLSLLPGVERVMRVTEPYKKANRKYHPEDTVIELSNGRSVGGNRLAVIAGPCSVESEAQICAVAEDVKASGAALLRGGAFKPRTSPYSFQGMGTAGLDLLMEARKQTGLPIEKLLFQLLITLLFPLIVLFIRLIAFLFLQDLLTALPQLLRLCLLQSELFPLLAQLFIL